MDSLKQNVIAPVTYQGGKQRIASQIIDIINPQGTFHDLCCGSGAISIELINRDYPVKDIIMLDKSPWGLFWSMVGLGSFDLDVFKVYCDKVPKNRNQIKPYIQDLFNNNDFSVYAFLLLQASTFGGAAVWLNEKWYKSGGFRNYWLPTETSNRRSPVNPMMPMPDSLFNRVLLICEHMKGITGLHQDINTFMPTNGIAYIDPPYANTAVYECGFDVVEYAKSLSVKCFVSEGKSLSDKSYLIASNRKKGNMSGNGNTHEEWLSEFTMI